jgi:hypothetical protein
MRSVSLTSAVEVQDIIHPFLRPLRSPVDVVALRAALMQLSSKRNDLVWLLPLASNSQFLYCLGR